MNSGERLIGEHEGLVVDPDSGGALTPTRCTRPTRARTRRSPSTRHDGRRSHLDDGNEIRGFNIDPQSGGGGIAGALGDTGGGTIDDVNIVDNGTAGTQPGLELNGTTGTFNIIELHDEPEQRPPGAVLAVQLTAPARSTSRGDAGRSDRSTNGAPGARRDGPPTWARARSTTSP